MALPALSLNAWLRYDLTYGVLRKLPDTQRVLEIGAGLGSMAVRLARNFEYVGLEPDATSFSVARSRLEVLGRGRLICGDVSALELNNSFDALCAFEVLEHIEDDAAALRAWHGCLRPGGWVVLSVPAGRHRYGAWDLEVGHYRRYEANQLAERLTDAGFSSPSVWRYGFPLGYFLEAGRNTIARRRQVRQSMEGRTASSGRRLQPPDQIGWLTMAAAAPFRLLQVPFRTSELGTGLVAVSQRPH